MILAEAVKAEYAFLTARAERPHPPDEMWVVVNHDTLTTTLTVAGNVDGADLLALAARFGFTRWWLTPENDDEVTVHFLMPVPSENPRE